MKIVAISDTHTKHESFIIPPCDLLIHAGDYSNIGKIDDVISFLDWFSKQPAKYKIFIGGNHDKCCDKKYDFDTGADLWFDNLIASYIDKGIHYIDNESIEIEGIKIFGSPDTPWFYGDYWARNHYRDKIGLIWDNIPADTDILVTHGPPYRIMDYVEDSMMHVGDESLLTKVREIKPKYHIFGHIHLDNTPNRIETIEGTTFINASLLDNRYKKVIDPIVIKYEKDNN